MGRRLVGASRRRTKGITVRLSPAEQAQVQRNAHTVGLAVSTYVRDVLLDDARRHDAYVRYTEDQLAQLRDNLLDVMGKAAGLAAGLDYLIELKNEPNSTHTTEAQEDLCN